MSETNTYTIEVTENDLTATLADLNIYRMDVAREGYTATADDTRERAEDMIRQALEQGYEDGESAEFGGNTVRVDDATETRDTRRRRLNAARGR